MNMHVNPEEFKPTRRALLRTVPAAGLVAMVAGAVPAAPADDPMCEWVSEWFKWRKVESDLSFYPGGGDFDMPEQLAAAAKYDALAQKIATSQAKTPAGVAAQLEWLDEDTDGLQSFCKLSLTGLRNAIAACRGGLV